MIGNEFKIFLSNDYQIIIDPGENLSNLVGCAANTLYTDATA